ncbi:hypothetical protein WJX75_008397 [Coccomyxa subellipsoidea]|uniref:Tyrosine specific protein phosphatases domain-containing protein n=1 Tax=Coccomyxa subellipsoidea TaxID=248742 RepID=A0ABR2YSD3_9CHLO
MSSEIIQNWSLDEPPQHALTIQSLLKEQEERGRTIGLIIDLSNHETLYAEDLQAVEGIQYAHIPLVAKAFPPAHAINQVIKTAKTYWKEHPKKYIGIHCAYGFNRTGFVVCAYLIQVCSFSVQEALACFGAARPPGVKHEKFVVELSRRYGTRLPSVPAAPAAPHREPTNNANDISAAQDPSSTSVLGMSPVGGSPPDLQIRGGSSSGRFVRLYPDGADPSQPWEPGTPSNENVLATQQVWDSLSRGQQTAYRFRAASELSVAGSEAGGRFSDDEAARSSIGDGHFSCSSVFSEFGYVAQHLEEQNPGVALARSSMRPLPPRSTASDTSTVASDLAQMLSYGPPAAPDAFPADAAPYRSPSLQLVLPQPPPVQPPARAESPVDISRADPPAGGGKDILRSGSWERRPTGLLSASFAAKNRCLDNDAAAPNGVHDSAASPRVASSSRSPTGAGFVTARCSRAAVEGAASLQKSFVSNSSLHSESAMSLTNNESLGLDERNIFKNFDKMAASRRMRTVSKEEDGDVEVQSRLTLEEIQAGFPGGEEENDFDMEMGHTDGSDAHPPLLDTAACTPPTPFASSAVQNSPDLAVEDGGDSVSHGNGDQTLDPGEAAEGGKEIGAGVVFSHIPIIALITFSCSQLDWNIKMPHRGLQLGLRTRSPFEWLRDLQRGKADAVRGERAKVTIADVIDRANDPRGMGSLEPTSPRSVEACLRLGIEPCELHFMPPDVFMEEFGDKELAQIAYSHHERIRQERLEALMTERKKISGRDEEANDKAAKGGRKGEAESGDMVEREAKRLEVLKRRQEREMGQLVQSQLMRKTLQDKAEAKVAALEARSEEQRKERAQAEAEWRRQQRDRELKRAQEEIEREKEVKAMEVARYARELEEAQREAAAEKQRRKDAYAAEQERRAKAEEARAETERILAQQAADLAAKKADMERRDAERELAKAAKMEEAAAANLAARAKAEARIETALRANAAILRERRAAFDQKQAFTGQRNLQKDAVRKQDEAESRRQEAEAEAACKAAYDAAMRREQQRVASILAKQREKDQKLEELNHLRNHEIACTKLKHQLDLELKRDKVEAMRRRDLYGREQLLAKIRGETERAHELLDARSSLQEQRKLANMDASFQRQKLMQAMDTIKAKKNWTALASPHEKSEFLTLS